MAGPPVSSELLVFNLFLPAKTVQEFYHVIYTDSQQSYSSRTALLKIIFYTKKIFPPLDWSKKNREKFRKREN